MRKMHKYEQYYNSVDFPGRWYFQFGRKILRMSKDGSSFEQRIWRFDPWGFLFDRYDGLFRRMAWARGTYPSYWTGFADLFDNVAKFLTPWYRPRRVLLENLVNPNESKLLSSDRKSAYFRNRSADTTYFLVECGFVNATMYAIRYVDDAGEAQNTFALAIQAMSGQETKEPEEMKTKLLSGPVLTWSQCERFLNAAVSATEGMLRWYDPDEDG